MVGFLTITAASAAADTDRYPLDPPDTSSPRATLESFIASMNEAHQAYVSGASGELFARSFLNAVACLDLSEAPVSLHGDVGGYTVLLLKEILDRIDVPEPDAIPGAEDVVATDLTKWLVPRTEIAITQVAEGDRAGAFLFSPRTVARMPEFYDRVRHLSYKPGATRHLLDFYYDNPGGVVPLHWAEWLPDWSMARVFERPIWKWGALAVFLVASTAVIVLLYRVGRRWDQGVNDGAHYLRVGWFLAAVGVMVVAWSWDVFVDDVIGLRGQFEAVVKRVSLVFAFSAAIVALFAFLEIVSNAIVASNRIATTSAQAHFIRIILRLVGIGLSVYLVIEASAYIGWAVAPVLAGLGVGGLAVALAARPTIENIIGGLVLFLDKPARVGDFCRYGDKVGTVEEVGLRSTRIRSLDRTVISVPNAELSQMPIENFNRRDSMLFHSIIGLRYETTSDQLRFVLTKLREMLIGHPRVSPDPARARFWEFGPSSLDVEIFAYVRTDNWNEYIAIREDLNLRIIDIIRDSGTSIAFPSRTLYWRRDAGMDAERGRDAEDEMAHLRTAGRLPFPDFAKDVQWEIEDLLDYPQPGSPDHRPRTGVSEQPTDPDEPTTSAPK